MYTATVAVAARSAGTRRALSRYVRPHFGAYSPDGTRSVRLPPALYDLWVALTDRPNETIPYLALTQAFWPSACAEDPVTTRVYVGRLRTLLVQVGWPAGSLEVVWGQGVIFHPPERRVIDTKLTRF